MNSKNQDLNGNPFTDLKKMYSSHVLENMGLHRQKSGLDHAKAKKMRELSHNENIFLRKYSKYAVPGFNKRRSSIDAGLIRNIEMNNSRPQSHTIATTKDKSFGRESVNSECPYSFETWNSLVDSGTSIIEKRKNDILYGNEEKRDTEKPITDDYEARKTPLLKRSNSLKPVLKSNEDDSSSEITELHNFRKAQSRGRRHSVALGAISTMGPPKNSDVKLPKIGDKKSSLKSSSTPDLVESNDRIKTEKSVSFEKTILKTRCHKGRRYSSADIQLDMKSRIPSISVTDNDNDLIHHDFGLEKDVRPVPNAIVVVRKDHDETTKSEQKQIKEGTIPSELTREINVLPSIPQSPSQSPSPDRDEEKTSDDGINNCEISDISVISATPSSLRAKSPYRRRRGSFSLAELKLLVDSHHGSAKLRYISKLATEMEKEERAKQGLDKNGDVYKELENCRYLRVPSSEVDNSENSIM